MFTVVITIVLVLLSAYSFLIQYGRLSHIPGPIHLPVFGNSLQLEPKPHIKMHEMVKKYGPVYRLNFQGNPCVIVCNFDTIYEMLVTKSADFAGRPSSYLTNVFTEGRSGIVRTDYGPEVQGRRKLVHMYLKQYGVRMKKLEEITMVATTDMLQCLAKLNGKPVNINETLFNCVSNITAIMLLGETFSPQVTTEIKQVFQQAAMALSKSLSLEIVSRIPIMRYFGNRAYKAGMINVEMKASLIDKWLLSKPENGLIHYMQELTEDDKHKFQIDELKHHRQVIFKSHLKSHHVMMTFLVFDLDVLFIPCYSFFLSFFLSFFPPRRLLDCSSISQKLSIESTSNFLCICRTTICSAL